MAGRYCSRGGWSTELSDHIFKQAQEAESEWKSFEAYKLSKPSVVLARLHFPKPPKTAPPTGNKVSKYLEPMGNILS